MVVLRRVIVLVIFVAVLHCSFIFWSPIHWTEGEPQTPLLGVSCVSVLTNKKTPNHEQPKSGYYTVFTPLPKLGDHHSERNTKLVDMEIPLINECRHKSAHQNRFHSFIPVVKSNYSESSLYGKRIVFLGDSTLQLSFNKLVDVLKCTFRGQIIGRCDRMNFVSIPHRETHDIWIPPSLNDTICRETDGRICPGGVGPSMFALSKLKEGITGCTDCMACGSQRMNCRDPKNLHQVEFESIALEFTRDVSVQTPLHVYTQEAVVKEYLKKFKPHAIVLKLGYHDTRVSNAEQFAANLEWLLSMIDEELNADVPFTGRSFRAVQGSYTEPKVLLVGPQYINHHIINPLYANITTGEMVLAYQKAMIQQAKRREHVQFLESYEVSSHECLRNTMADGVHHSQLMYEWLIAAILRQLEVMLM